MRPDFPYKTFTDKRSNHHFLELVLAKVRQ